jgi:pimeloyl-ACP methyl ester carboxylesterase
VTLSVTIAGTGPPLLLLHGFPDSALLWRHQIPALAATGYTVIAPNLRGSGGSDAPAGTAAYHADRILDDLLGLLRALEISDPVGLIGHDWGAAIGWLLCMRLPERVYRFAALSVGHPAAYRGAGLRQKLKGWYILAFLLPGVAEGMIRADGFRFLRRVEPTLEDGQRWAADPRTPGAPDRGPELVPGERPALPGSTVPAHPGACAWHLQHRRCRADRGADDGIGPLCAVRVALRPHVRRGPLAAYRAAGRDQRAAARLVRRYVFEIRLALSLMLMIAHWPSHGRSEMV